ncbi:unnamed protein product [Prunus brigantina]
MPTYVKELIEPTTKQWKSAEVDRFFLASEAELIKSMAISKWGCPDKRIWHFTNHGGFTVKSAYEVAQFLQRNGELGRQGQGEPSVRNNHRPLWTSIWKLQVPPKIRNFVWRACLNTLAFARVFWFSCPLQFDTRLITEGDFLACWQFLLKKYEHEDNRQDILQWLAIGLWRLWKNRNAAIFQGQHALPHEIALTCQKQIEEFVAAGPVSIPLIHDQPRPPEWDRSGAQTWQKPADSWMKVNCDGAWAQATMKGGAGWVARDCNGWMEMAGGVGGFSCASALAAEAVAMREAVAVGMGAGFTKLVVETDSKQLVAMVHGDLKTDTTIDGILHDIKLMASEVGQISFVFVNRRCNAAAHLVAAHVARLGGEFKWDQLWPEWLFDTLAADVLIPIRF